MPINPVFPAPGENPWGVKLNTALGIIRDGVNANETDIADVTLAPDPADEGTYLIGGIEEPYKPVGIDSDSLFPPRVEARLANTLVPRQFAPTVQLESLPMLLNSRRRYQQSAYTQDNVTTLPDGTQFGVNVDDNLHPVVWKRTAGKKDFTTFDLRNVVGDPFGAQIDDSHGTYSLAVDSAGNVHVSGNMHTSPMHAVVTTTPGDITTFATETISATNTNLVTYPMYFMVNDVLWLAWRNGYATGGDYYVSKFSAGAWTAPVMLFNGGVSAEGPYLWRVAVRGSKISLFFCWRGSGDASTNTDFGYVESIDGGSTWTRIDGTPQTVPITHANADTIIPTPIESGLINQGGADIDVNGHPHAGIQLYDANGKTQLHHVWYDGTGWVNEQVTDWTQRVETIGQTTLLLMVARPHVVCTDTGRTYLIGRTSAEGFNGSPVMIDVSPGADRTPFKIADMDLAGWEPAIDGRALRERGELTMQIMSIDHVANIKEGWLHQWGGVLTIPLGNLQLIQSGIARIPGIKLLNEFPVVPEVAAVGGTTEVNITTFGFPQIDMNRMHGPGMKFFARLTGRFNFNAGTTSGKFLLRESPSAGTLPTHDICVLQIPTTSYNGINSTPWEPLRGTPYREANGLVRDTRLIPRALADNAAGFRVGAWSVQVGVLGWV